MWRAGANTATTLQTDADLKIGDLDVPAGTYTLFVDISDPAQLDPDSEQEDRRMGAGVRRHQGSGQDEDDDGNPPAMVEDLKYTLTDDGGSKGTMTLAWEHVSASVNFSVH